MFRYLKTNRAQAVSGEYVLVFFLVVGMMTAMTFYFKRAVQARIYDARNTMFNTVLIRAKKTGYYTGNLLAEYEPYYDVNRVSTIVRKANIQTKLLPGASSGIFRKVSDEITAAQIGSETAPPKEAR